MKKCISCILILSLVFSLSGCGVLTMLRKTGGGKPDQAGTPADMPTEPETAPPAETPEVPETVYSEDQALTGTVVYHYMKTERTFPDGTPCAECIYPELVPDDQARETYPDLCSMIDEMVGENADRSSERNMLAMYVRETEERDLSKETSWQYRTLYITRADERVFSYYIDNEIRDPYGDEYHYYGVENLNSGTGLTMLVSDVVTDPALLTDPILENLTDLSSGENVSSDTVLQEECRDYVEDYLEYGWLDFVLTENAMRVLFAGDNFEYGKDVYADLPYDRYPDLFREEVAPVALVTPAKDRFPDGEVVSETVSDSELEEFYGDYGEENGEGENYFYIENPGWDGYYVADGIDNGGITGLPYKIEKTKEDASDWLNETEWANEQGIELPERLPFDDGNYSYYVYNLEESLGLEIVEDVSGDEPAWSAYYDFSEYLDPPDRAGDEDIFAEFADLEIQYALTDGNTVYVEIGHNTYSSSQPHTSFIVALEAETGKLLWKSEELVAGGNNFVIYDETVICGYGFTSEPDYLYVLNCHNGEKLETMKLRSAPSYFVLEEDELYVVTYNTGYIFKLKG